MVVYICLLNRKYSFVYRCAEAYAVLQRKLDDTTRWFWPQVSDGDGDSNRRAAFGHLIEGLLQREQPEVYNAFKVSVFFNFKNTNNIYKR